MCFHTLSSFLCHADYEEFIKTFWRVNTTGNIYLLIFSTILVLHKVMNLRYNAARFDLNVELPLILWAQSSMIITLPKDFPLGITFKFEWSKKVRNAYPNACVTEVEFLPLLFHPFIPIPSPTTFLQFWHTTFNEEINKVILINATFKRKKNPLKSTCRIFFQSNMATHRGGKTSQSGRVRSGSGQLGCGLSLIGLIRIFHINFFFIFIEKTTYICHLKSYATNYLM